MKIKLKIPHLRQKVSIPSSFGEIELATFSLLSDQREHIAIIFDGWDQQPVTDVRIHSKCFTGDTLGSQKCDCGDQLKNSMETFSKTGGVILYLMQEGRDIGLYNKVDAYSLQTKGLDTVEANQKLGFDDDHRCFKVAAEMLQALNIFKVNLFTNNPKKVYGLEFNGITVNQRLSTGLFSNKHNIEYLKTKVKKSGHLINIDEEILCN